MTRNPVGDQEDFSAVYWSSIANAVNQEAIVSGCTPTAGSGGWDVDISGGEALVQGSTVTVSSDTVTVDPADTTADRVDLVTVDGTGTVSVTRGAADASGEPVAPDIPDGEVLVAAVLVAAGSSSLSDGDSTIADYRTIYELSPEFNVVTATSATIADSLTDPSGTEHTGELADVDDLHARYSDEEVQDVVGALLSGGSDVSLSYDDVNDTLTITFDSHGENHESGGSDELSVTGLSGDLADPQDPKQEAVEDIVGSLVSGGTNVTSSYDDSNDTLTIDTSALNEEEVEDAVAALLTTDSNLTLNYDDGNDVLTVGLANSVSVNDLSVSNKTTTGALEAESAAINGHTSQDPRKLVAFRNLDSSTINETHTINVGGNDSYNILEILRFTHNGSTASSLDLTIDGLSDGDYNYTVRDETGAFTRRTGQNEFRLVEAGTTTDGASVAAIFELHASVDRPSISGRGTEGFRTSADWLTNGASNQTFANLSENDITISASSDANLQLYYAIWEVQDRGQI